MIDLSKEYISNLFFSITEADKTDSLWSILTKFLADFELLHGRISIFDLSAEVGPSNLRHMRTFPDSPESWGEHYRRSNMWIHDRSFHLIFEHCTEALEWQQMEQLTRQGTEAYRVFEEMRDFGIGNGLLLGKASAIHNQTILLGIAGPARVFREFKKKHYNALLHSLHTFNTCYLALVHQEGKLDPVPPSEMPMTDRTREIVRLLSRDHTSAEIADMLGISEHGLNQALKRLRSATGLKTRTGIVAKALRAKVIQ